VHVGDGASSKAASKGEGLPKERPLLISWSVAAFTLISEHIPRSHPHSHPPQHTHKHRAVASVVMPRRATKAAAAAAPAASASSTSSKKKEEKAPGSDAATTAPAAAAAAKKSGGVEEEVEDVFEENESVLAKDSGQLYEAKVQKVQEGKKGNPPQYFIHYLGWKSKWDKWVGSETLLKKNEMTLKLQAQLRQASKKRPGGGGGGGGGEGEEGGKSEDHSKRGKKEGGGGGEGSTVLTDPDVEPVVERANDPQVKLAMPFTLKKQLVDDWEMVTR